MFAKWIEKDNGFSFSESDNGGLEISYTYYKELLFQNGKGTGIIGRNSEGLPVIVDLPKPSSDEVAAAERAWRDREIDGLSWLRERHRDQLEIGFDPTLGVEQFIELLIYMQGLRDWPQSLDFPAHDQRPIQPDWIAEQTR